MDFIETQMNAHGDIAERYAELGRLFDRKLWHQLTVALEAFADDPACLRGDNLFSSSSEDEGGGDEGCRRYSMYDAFLRRTNMANGEAASAAYKTQTEEERRREEEALEARRREEREAFEEQERKATAAQRVARARVKKHARLELQNNMKGGSSDT